MDLSKVTDKNNYVSNTYKMNCYEHRLQSFEGKWPYTSNCACTPENMAKAGFYHCGGADEPDLAMCYVCLKQLDGWEPTDDPWEEHVSHSKSCLFLKQKKNQPMTVESFLKLEVERTKNGLQKQGNAIVDDFLEYAENCREELAKLL